MPYAELHCKTHFSFLEGASFPDELVSRGAQLGLGALGITDRNSLCGVVQAHQAAKESTLKLLIGAEITPDDGPPILLYPKDRAAYGRLSRLITVGRRRAEKGECLLRVADVVEHAAGIVGIALPGARPEQRRRYALGKCLEKYREGFAKRLYLGTEFHFDGDSSAQLARHQRLAREHRLRLLACNDVHYHDLSRRPLQDVLACIRNGCTIQNAGARLFPNGERRLKSEDEMRELFPPELIERTMEVAEACQFSLNELRYEYPEELTPKGKSPAQWLAELTWGGARERWPDAIPRKVRTQIEHELALINELKYEAYFLTVWDLVHFARQREILCQGRGSAANSAVCYCLGVTSVDPARSDVLFERFISRERAEAPDIDVDFEHERREEVMQYVYEKYGRERAGIVAEVITYRPKSAVRDIGKALGMSLDRVELLSSTLESFGTDAEIAGRLREAGLDPEERAIRQLVGLTRELLGFPRHLSQHVGGFVITAGPLCELVPIENASMPGRTVIEWDKDDIDDLKILKVDCLALGMLTCIHKCFDLIEAHYGRALTLATIPAEDPAVYEMCCRADTIGVFQIESRAQMSMLPRLRPQCFYDLVVEVSIVRPGPIQGGMVHPYLKRRASHEAVSYPNDAIKAVLEKTLGVPLFQEQVMRLAMVAAGFSPGEADQLRRAMGAWRRPGVIERLREKMLAGMLKNNLPRDYAETIFEQIRGFGEYGFPESHAASFALLVYASAWLKHYYPAAFTTALLNSQPMGFYAPAQLIRDAQNHGVTVHPVDVNRSEWDCILEKNNGIRLGFRLVKGLSQQKHVAPILAAGKPGERRFASIAEFARRTRLTKAVLSRLAAADAFQGLGAERRKALWQVLSLHEELPLFELMDAVEPPVALAQTPLQEHISQDYETTGLSLRAHPLSLLRSKLTAAKIVSCAKLHEMKDGSAVRTAGLVLVRQRPETASGTVFMTIEDETGQANLIVWPSVFERNRKAGKTSSAVIVEGKLQRESGVTHVVVKRLLDLSESLPKLGWKSRDFR